MDVHFCDICNESVPLRDLERGRAFLRKGRVVCAACDSAMAAGVEAAAAGATAGASDEPDGAPAEPYGAPAPPAPPPPHAAPAHAAAPPAPAGAGLAVVLAALGILLTASVAVLVFERLDQAGRRAEQQVGDLRADLRTGMDALRDEIVAGSATRAEEGRRLERELAAVAAREEERARQVDALASELQRIDGELAELARALDRQEAFAGELARLDRRAGELAAGLGEVRSSVGLVAERLLELERRPAPLAGLAAEPVSDAPAWASIAEELKSTSAGARWSAVQELGKTGDPAVAPHLVPMLKDADIFVRMAAARYLGELGAPIAIPALIDALEDEEASVREQAVVSLRRLTGMSFKFDPTANEAERAKRVKAWRDWWKKSGEAELG